MNIKTNRWFIIFILFTCCTFTFHICNGAATITASQSLSGDKTIVSSGGVFELGFFRPGNSPNYYIGIWYKKVQQTIVWVANRDKPVSDKYSSELRILDGNLVLLNESRIPIWSTNLESCSTSSSIQAVLLDIGNLVLRNGPVAPEPLWQSFDHLTDTWLSWSKLGFNKITGRTTLLTSWKSKDDPAPGLFSYELDPKGTHQFFVMWNRSRQVWTSGNVTGESFTEFHEMRLNSMYNLTYVDNEDESYATYNTCSSSIIIRFVIDVGGQIQQQTLFESAQQWFLFWSSRVQCGAFGIYNVKSHPFCNCLRGFHPKSVDDWDLQFYSTGCARKTSLQCDNSSLVNGNGDRFFPSYNMKLPANPNYFFAVGSAQGCESACLDNCSCTAYAYDNDNHCSVWFGDLLDLQHLADDDPSGRTLYVRVAASDFSSSINKMAVGIVIGSAVIIVALGIVVFVILRRREKKFKMAKVRDSSLVTFGYKDLQSATKNFSQKLGEGSFGSVFKGILPDSSVIAVKKLESVSQGEKQFRTEIGIIGTIQHINLVRLRGFCSKGTRKLLVYDYMPNGSLDSHLFHGKCSEVLDWKTRYKIALGTARGLAYLHEKCRECIIHCDIKPDNILLDAEFCPKLADFGLAKLFGRNFSRVLTTVRGTVGYLAPEWISGVAITAKADVYSYGMMLFELVSGRRNSEQPKDGKMEYFPIQVARLMHENGDFFSLLDPRLEGNADVEEITRVCEVACWCIQDDETQRPSMGQVVHILEGVLDVNLPPIPRFLQSLGDSKGDTIFY